MPEFEDDQNDQNENEHIHPHYDEEIGLDLDDIYVTHKSAFQVVMQVLDGSLDGREIPDAELLAQMRLAIEHYRESTKVLEAMENDRPA